MEKAKISRKELESYLRLTGTDDISEIKTSHLEKWSGKFCQKKIEEIKSSKQPKDKDS